MRGVRGGRGARGARGARPASPAPAPATRTRPASTGSGHSGVAYRRQLVRGRNARAPSVGGWRDARGRARVRAAHRHTPAGGATAQLHRQGKTDSLNVQ